MQFLCEMSDAFVELADEAAHYQLFFEGFMKLEHVEVGHEYEIVSGGLFQSLHNKVVHECDIVEEVGSGLIEEAEGGVELMHPFDRLQDG